MSKMVKISLLLASTLTVMAGAAIAPALPTIAQYFSKVAQADLLTKLLLTLPALCIALFSPLAGLLIDRLGKLTIFKLSIILYIISGTSGFLLSDLYLLLLSRALLGIAVAGIMTTAVTLAGDYFQGEERNRFLGSQAAVMAFGGTIFVGFSGLLADFGWRFPFLIYFLALPVLFMVNRYLPEPEQSRSGALGNKPVAVNREIKAIRIPLLIYLTAFFGMIAFYIVPVQSPFLLQHLGADRPSLQGLGLIGATIAAALLSQNFARILRVFDFRSVFALCFGLMAIGFFIISWSHYYWQAILGLLLAGGGVGLLMPNSNTWLMQIAPVNIRGRMMGMLTMAIFLGQFFSPIIFEPLVRQGSLQGAHFWVALALMVMGLGYLISSLSKQLVFSSKGT